MDMNTDTNTNTNTDTDNKIPDNFKNIIFDMIDDFSVTFPEFSATLDIWNRNNFKGDENPDEITDLFKYCLDLYPKHFFNILYQNPEMFGNDNTNTHFLPDIDFKIIIHDDTLSEKSKQIVWKYLQLILFTVIGTIKEKTDFGDHEKMFSDINSEELQEKINETITNMMGFFGEADAESKTSPDNNQSSYIPNPEEINNHLSGLFTGKIGILAKEMAENISEDFKDILGENITESSTPKDIMFNLMKNPDKIGGIVKSVTAKLSEKISSGEITNEELMKEATEMMGVFKGMDGMGKFGDLFKSMAGMASMPGMAGLAGMADMMGANIPKNSRVDTNAMNRIAKYQSMSERLKTKLDEKRKTPALEKPDYSIEQTDDKNEYVFKMNKDEIQEKTPLKPPGASTAQPGFEIDDKLIDELNADQLRSAEETRKSNEAKSKAKPKKNKNKNKTKK
jgi:hypothetical protein